MSLESVEISILDRRIGTKFERPKYQKEGDAGIDLIACIDERIVLHAHSDSILISTGISVRINNPGYAAVILPKSVSGHKKGLVLGSSVDLLSSNEQGELVISVWNRHESNPIFIDPGDCIAQLVFLPISRPTLKLIDIKNAKAA